jgi:hypothetical protein
MSEVATLRKVDTRIFNERMTSLTPTKTRIVCTIGPKTQVLLAVTRFSHRAYWRAPVLTVRTT